MVARTELTEDFVEPVLDESVWLPHYLPAWSSRSATAASWRIANSCLVMDIPRDHGLWCPGDHSPPLRVSGIQSGNFSGPAGSSAGQQPFREGLTVREEQPRFEGYLPTSGHVEIRCRMDISPRSMAALWLAGFEDEPRRCGEICVVEIFGKSMRAGASAEVGMGVHAFRDPALIEDWSAPRVPVDVSEFHTYAVDWNAEQAAFSVDAMPIRTAARPPTYPMQLMLGGVRLSGVVERIRPGSRAVAHGRLDSRPPRPRFLTRSTPPLTLLPHFRADQLRPARTKLTTLITPVPKRERSSARPR